ncbi:MAG: DivIVA domain-containing protein [Actinomycetota bacterium]
MELGARDVNEKQFNDAWRGYNQAEVDDFLDRVAEVLDRLQRENDALRNRMGELDQAVAASRNTEEMLKKTLVTAQRAAEEAIATAKSKAEQVIGEAEKRAAQAEADASRRNVEAQRVHAERKRELDLQIDRLKAYETDLKQKLKGFLEQQLRSLDTLGSGAPPPSVQRGSARPAAQPSRISQTSEQPEGDERPQAQASAGSRSFPWRQER